MRLLILTVFGMMSLTAQAAITCIGQKDVFTDGGAIVTTQVALKQTPMSDTGGVFKMTGEVSDVYFSILDRGGNFLAMITLGPNYMDGVTSSAQFDERNSLRITTVNPAFVAILNCVRN